MDAIPVEGISVIEKWDISDTLGIATFNSLTYGHMIESTHFMQRFYSIMINGVHSTNSESLAMGTNHYNSGSLS